MRENAKIDTFIDPGFRYRSEKLNGFYGGNLKGPDMQRIEFDRGHRPEQSVRCEVAS